MDLDSVWCLSSKKVAVSTKEKASSNVKRIWQGATLDDHNSWLSAGTEIKTIWVPYGE